MIFLASAAHGLENLLGRGAPSITFGSGRKTGLKVAVSKKSNDLLEALQILKKEMDELGIQWPFEPHKKKGESSLVTLNDKGEQVVKLAFQHCMVRSSLFRYGHAQKQSLCMMNHGLFCGMLEQILGARANLEIIHAGENACYKLLTVTPKK
ncbi:MAG: hypothetical protein HY901_18655 [Deltaproteobacteria bacterium]|nr:hypothetical protein [Deltaproteobacteria bacterium]